MRLAAGRQLKYFWRRRRPAPMVAEASWDAEQMGAALAALLSGAVLYLSVVAGFALHVKGASPWWWLAVVLVGLCHAAAGFHAISRGDPGVAAASKVAPATSIALSLGIAGIVSAVALLLALSFPVDLAPRSAGLLLAACIFISAITAGAAFSGRNRRLRDQR